MMSYDSLTQEERDAIAAFPEEKVKRYPTGVSGDKQYAWDEAANQIRLQGKGSDKEYRRQMGHFFRNGNFDARVKARASSRNRIVGAMFAAGDSSRQIRETFEELPLDKVEKEIYYQNIERKERDRAKNG